MQDIDFDELDRAVNSVINPDTDRSSSSSKPAERTVEIPERSTSFSPAARRSSGRFMDVVHPSSDMRPTTSEQSMTPPSVTTPTAEPSPFQWPDPMELEGTHTSSADEPEAPQEPEPSQPLESPFLPDAKVEKRPLGSPLPSEPETALETPMVSEETTALPTDNGPMPAELGEDILKLEDEETDIVAPTEPVEAPREEPISFSTPVVEAPIGPTSITQQYKEQPSTTAQPSGAIFDTEAYHQPLAHPEKKRSGLLVIVWILALILVGGGMGAAVYFFILPML